MSRKHYNEVAAIIRSARNEHGASPAVDDVASELASFFKRDNPRFDTGRFILACAATEVR